MTTKTCKTCKEDKELSDFHKNNAEKDKLCKHCKVCANIKNRKWRKDNPEKKKESARKSDAKERLKPHFKARHNANCKRYREVNNANACKASREYRLREKAKRPPPIPKPFKYYDELLSHVNRQSRYRFLKNLATPSWVDKVAIQTIYNKCRRLSAWMEERYEVDHIVPITSEFVCGLHCEANLAILSEFSNRSKSNRYWPDMWTN